MKIAVFEGPLLGRDVMHGWRKYQVRLQNGEVRLCICMQSRVHQMAQQLGAEFFAAGTWEDGAGHGSHPVHFPTPRRDILEKLCGTSRRSSPLSLSMRHNSDGEVQNHNH